MSGHVSVLLAETLQVLSPTSGDRILDVTLGLGGHAEALLSAADGTSLIGLDADMQNLAEAQGRLSSFGSRVACIHANFSSLPNCLPGSSREFDVILADLGVSSPHFDDPSRGFSFRFDAPLDMRFDRSSGMTGSQLLSSLDRTSVIEIFRDLGELRFAHKLADALIARRKEHPVRTTFDLRDAVIEAYGKHTGQDLLPQAFQALRMAVNRELDALRLLLDTAVNLLKVGGRFGVITFHSLEDRMVKNAFRELVTPEKHPVTGAPLHEPVFEMLTRKAIAPSEEEAKANPRARSARLRAIRRISTYTSNRF